MGDSWGEGDPWGEPARRPGPRAPDIVVAFAAQFNVGAAVAALGLIEGLVYGLAGAARFAGGVLAGNPERRRFSIPCLSRQYVRPGFATLCGGGESRRVVIPACCVDRNLIRGEAAVGQSQQGPLAFGH